MDYTSRWKVTMKNLKIALEKLQLNDAALVYEPETSAALGFGLDVDFWDYYI